MLGKERNKALPGSFWQTALGAPVRGQISVMRRDRKAIKAGRRISLEFSEPAVDGLERQRRGIGVELGKVGGQHIAGDGLFGRTDQSLKDCDHRDHRTGNGGQHGYLGQAAGERAGSGCQADQPEQQINTAIQARRERRVLHAIANIKRRFVVGSFVGGVLLHSGLLIVLAPVAGFSQAAPCSVARNRRTSSSPAKGLFGSFILADANASVLGMTAGETAPLITYQEAA